MHPPLHSKVSVSSSGFDTEVVDPVNGSSWDDEVASTPDHSPFHRAAWARVLCETYGHQPVYLKLTNNSGRHALLPIMEVASRFTGRRGVSLPFSDFAGPISAAQHAPELPLEPLEKIAMSRSWTHLEVREARKSSLNLQREKTFVGHELDLHGGVEDLKERLPSPTRRAIRKAERSGVSVSITNQAEDLESYYRLHARTRRRHGLPPQSLAFFRSIQRHMLSNDLGCVALASHQGKVIAGALFFWSGGQVVYKYGASEQRFWHLRPNQLLMWHVIQEAVGRSRKVFHFGRTSPNDTGLRQFKKSWATEETEISHHRFSCKTDHWHSQSGQSATRNPAIFRRLPIIVNRVAGSLIYPHLD